MFSCLATFSVQAQTGLQATFLSRYTANEYNLDGGVMEISAYDAASKRLFSINGSTNEVLIIDLTTPSTPTKTSAIDISTYGGAPNSVAVYNGVVAVAVEATVKQDSGTVEFFNASTAAHIKTIKVGALPDMLTFTPDGKYVIVCNEGEPNLHYDVDPEGTISIIDVTSGAATATVTHLNFNAYDSKKLLLKNDGVRIAGYNNPSVSKDLEPEYATVSSDSKTAWVTCQENNAVVIVDIVNKTIKGIKALGYKDHSETYNSLDASDRNPTNPSTQINMTTWPVRGLYMPDGIANMRYNNKTFILSANEGDARDYSAGTSGFIDEARISTLSLDATVFPNAATLKTSANIGRLKAIKTEGDFDIDTDYDALYTYGARSFTIWDSSMVKVYDSGNEFELYIKNNYAANFNANHNTSNQMSSRSDDKGPEPESVITATLGDSIYAFIGLERQSGVMIYNVTNPYSPYFVNYISTRNYSETPLSTAGTGARTGGDLGPEGLLFIPKTSSPGSKALLVVSYEVSGTVSLYELTEPAKATQVTGVYDIDQENVAFTVYPNPSHDSEVLNFSKTAMVKVYAMQGNLVYESNEALTSINVSQLPKGIYYVVTSAGESTKYIKN